jgi:hypothetical protein
LVDAECLRQCPPSGTEENGVKLAVVLKEDPKAFWDREDRVAMRDVFDNFAVNMLSELYRSFGSTGGTYSAAFARECNKERVLAAVAVYPSCTVCEDATV